MHLAAFYFDGRFANFAMRAAGAKLAYTREQDEPRARYAVLGVLLLVQAAAEAASASGQAAARWRAASDEASSRNAESGDGRADGEGRGGRSEGADSVRKPEVWGGVVLAGEEGVIYVRRLVAVYASSAYHLA